MRLTKPLILAVSFLFLINQGAAFAQEKSASDKVTQDIEIILDASGSMMARIGKQTKIDIAKKVLIDLVESLKDRSDLALAVRVYGHQFHRDEKNCKDTKLEIPFGKPDLKKVKALMADIKAQGWTPIAYSLLEAKKDFDLKADRKRTIILITDGLESCGGNPCKVAEELFKAGISIHVIAFDLTEKELTQLKCIVKPSNGLLLSARDAEQLEKALREAVSTSLGGTLRLKALRDGKAITAMATVYHPGTKDSVFPSSWINIDKPAEFKLLPGVYDVEFKDTGVAGEPTVTLPGVKIEAGKTVEKTGYFSGGGITISVLKNDAPSAAWIVINDSGGKRIKQLQLNAGKSANFELVPGTYDVIVEDTDISMSPAPKQVFKVEIQPGETVEKTAKFYGGTLRVRILKGGKQIKGAATLYKPGTKSQITWQWTRTDKWAEFKLVPGTYDIKFEDDKGIEKMVKGVTIKAKGTETVEAKY